MRIDCAACGVEMRWEKVVANVVVPQWEGVTPYRIDRFRCPTCGEHADAEVDAESSPYLPTHHCEGGGVSP